MNEIQLSKRLTYVGELVPIKSRLADIGSDHAYLPVALVLQDKIDFAVAGEVVKGPYESAKTQVIKNGLNDKIIVRLANGLNAINKEDQITAITICGMGGALIRTILDEGVKNGKIDESQRLILQPNVGEHIVRKWLFEHDYEIMQEKIIEENNKCYEIIMAEKKKYQVEYSLIEILFGPKLIEEKSYVFRKKWRSELIQKEQVLKNLEQAKGEQKEKKQIINAEINLIKEVLN